MKTKFHVGRGSAYPISVFLTCISNVINHGPVPLLRDVSAHQMPKRPVDGDDVFNVERINGQAIKNRKADSLLADGFHLLKSGSQVGNLKLIRMTQDRWEWMNLHDLNHASNLGLAGRHERYGPLVLGELIR